MRVLLTLTSVRRVDARDPTVVQVSSGTQPQFCRSSVVSLGLLRVAGSSTPCLSLPVFVFVVPCNLVGREGFEPPMVQRTPDLQSGAFSQFRYLPMWSE